MSLLSLGCLQAEVLVDFNAGPDLDPDGNPFTLTVSDLASSPPSVSTSDSSGAVPQLSGSFTGGSGSIEITLDGRSDGSSDWDGVTWSGGTAYPLDWRSGGYGLNDPDSVSRVDGGEAILWTFDTTSLALSPGEFLVLKAASFDGYSDAQLWYRASGAATGNLVSVGATWEGSITIGDGDAFGLASNSRLESLTLDVVLVGPADVPANLTATPGVSSVSLDWDDDSSGAFESFTVYRSTASPVTAGDFLADTLTSDYVDDTAEIGVTYYYTVTATGTDGSESAMGSEASATPVLPASSVGLFDASDSSAGTVSVWADQSGGGNDLVADEGTVAYPSVSLSSAGVAGLDFGPGRNTLSLTSDAWLDQSSGGDGFVVVVAFKVDDLVPGVFNDLLGNSTDGSTGLQLGYTSGGQIQARLGTGLIAVSGKTVEAGDSVVVALRYDAVSETLELWETANYGTATTSVAKADFRTLSPVTLGGSDDPGQFFNGMVGELQVFDSALDDALFKEVRERVLHRWIASPNIIFLFVDDWGWSAAPFLQDERMQNSGTPLSFTGFGSYMPNLETLAQQGMIFRNAYASPQCGPSRVSVQTGSSNARNGFTVVMGRNSGYYDFDSGQAAYPLIASTADNSIRPEFTTIPEALSPLGYNCAHIGKWHSGGNPGDEGYILHDGNTGNKPGNTLIGGDISTTSDPKLTGHITETALEFIEEQDRIGRPFYAQLSYYAMHGGFECTVPTRNMFQDMLENDYAWYSSRGITDPSGMGRNDNPAVWLGMAWEMDQSFGAVIDKLEELGIEDNTYIVMMADNGMRHGQLEDLTGQPQPFHVAKWWVWQGGIRVPMVVKGPGIAAGSYNTTNVANFDMLPTFLDWAGGDPSTLQDIDGTSLEGLMEGEPPTEAFLNRPLYFHFPNYRSALPHSSMVKGHYKLVHFYETQVLNPLETPYMLFDIGSDPGENVNLTDTYPTMAADLFSEMVTYLDDVEARIPVPNFQADYDAAVAAGIPSRYQPVNSIPGDWLFYDSATYQASEKYDLSNTNGFFTGTRTPKSDENSTLHTFTDYWLESWGVDIGSLTNDYDGDGCANLIEYLRGGDPTDPFDKGFGSSFWVEGDRLKYRYTVRNDDSNARAVVETATELNPGDWDPSGFTTDSTVRDGTQFDEITVSIPIDDDAGFIRLLGESDVSP